MFIYAFIHLHINILKPSQCDKFSVSTFQGEFKVHSLKAMQDVHLCMYVCMHVCMYIYIYVSQRDFRQMSFTAGRCGTPLIPQ